MGHFPWRFVISWLSKGTYLGYMAVFVLLGMRGMMFAFSVWIINDQYEKACMLLDADRLRRSFDDRWLFRLLYLAGLLVPCVSPGMPDRVFSLAYGTGLLLLWEGGVCHASRRGLLFQRPEDAGLLRNMVYVAGA